MGEVGLRFCKRAERLPLRARARAEPRELWEDEPDPMGAFLSCVELGEGGVEGGGVGVEEALEGVHWGAMEHMSKIGATFVHAVP